MPASAARLAANRANARRSTGPRTPAGKCRSAQNARKHGLLARTHLLPPDRAAAAIAEAQAIANDTPDPRLKSIVYQQVILCHRSQFLFEAENAFFNLYNSQPIPAKWFIDNPHFIEPIARYKARLHREQSACDKLLRQALRQCKQTQPAPTLTPQTRSVSERSLPEASARVQAPQCKRTQPPQPRTQPRRTPAAPSAHATQCKRTQRTLPAPPAPNTPHDKIKTTPHPENHPLKIGFVSLGCPKNLVDTEVMMGQLAARGHSLTSSPNDADAIVVNTCSFIDPAKQESVDTILEMAEFKRTGRARRLIVAGCLVERYRDDILATLPDVDAVLGTNELDSIVDLCEGADPQSNPLQPYLYHDLTPRILATPRHYAYIKINEGCDHPCTFCVIPQFRGNFRSRRFESVVAEATRLFEQGVREINLIGQDTTAYGDDLGMTDGLALLLDRLARIETPHKKWIRFLYCYPNRITPRLLDTLAAHPALVKYIDMPLQHASPRVLKRMKRGASGDIFLKSLEKIRRTVPGVAIRTSMIVGFPGESESDFDHLLQFTQAAQFDRLGVFSYSDEETSASFHLDAKVSKREIYNRRRALMALQRKISRRLNRRFLGAELPVLIEGPSPESDLVFQARLATQAPDIDGVCYVSDFGDSVPRPGEFRTMRITKTHDYDLVGDLNDDLESAPPAPLNPFPIISTSAGHRHQHQ